MDTLVVLLIAGLVIVAVASYRRQQQRRRELLARQEADLAAVKRTADEDVTRYGEEVTRLDTAVLGHDLDDAGRQDYQRALDCYEQAKDAVQAVSSPDEVRHVTEVLEDGRYAVACVKARIAGQPLPQRRPPCFFNPGHGPSTTDISWAPPGGQKRDVPVCAADAERVEAGADPDIRTVMHGPQRVPYWQGGPAYSPWAQGYFGSYAASGLLPGFLIGSMLTGGLGMGGWDAGGEGGGDVGADGGGDFGGDAGDGGDVGGDGGGFDGGGFDGGGFDGGGFDFGGDFGGFG
jgi:type II secretory pathway pseudopilin PulG